jgi:ADP-heptose:LPS heptosyltransferase
VLQDLSLCLLAGILLQVSLYIGHDSGVTHLSARLGVPTVALFGPTSSDRWAPRGFHVVVARGGPCHCPSWDDVSRCAEKPCLHLSLADILAASLTLRSKGVNPRICSLSALSPTSPYVRVTT